MLHIDEGTSQSQQGSALRCPTSQDVGRPFKALDADRIEHHAWPITNVQAFVGPLPMRGLSGNARTPQRIKTGS
jgi:hypothetical protein